MSSVLISGGTGYIGRRLAPALLTRGHDVRVLARRESVTRVPAGATAIVGSALSAADVAAALTPDTTLVHLVGTPHPSPSKAAEFKAVDLPAARASIGAAAEKRIAHLVYVSVAHPAPVMEAYIASRAADEQRRARDGCDGDPAELKRRRLFAPRYSALFGLNVEGIFTAAGSGVKSSPGLMKRSDSNAYCLSYSVR